MTDESVVVDDGQTYVSEETAEIAKQAMNQAKQWAEESERQANLATGAADDAIDAKNYAQAAITDENLVMVANDLNSPSGKINTVVNNMSDINTVVDNIEDIQDAYDNALKAKDWAIKMDGTVDGVEYSAKYYADLAGQNAGALSGANKDLSNLTPTGNDKFVTKDTSQTIGGTKTFTADLYIYNDFPTIYQRQPNFNKGDIPQTEIFANNAFTDDSGTLGSTHQLGTYGCSITTTGEIRTYLRAYRNVEGSTDGANLEIRYPIDGNPYTYAPTPTDTTSTSSHQIATVGWVNSANNNVVHKTGSETISGTKTFQGTGWITHIKNTSVTYNTAPSSDTTTAIAFVDKNSNSMGVIDCFRLTDNSTMMQFSIYGRNGSWATRPLEFKINSNGSEVAFAPASDVINSIVTTTAIHKASGKGSFKLGNGMIVNYGAQQMNKDSTTVITFDTPFTGNYTYGLSTGYKSSISRDDPITISDRTSTNFTARNTARDSDAVTCIYVAIGY